MPETPDFDAIAQRLLIAGSEDGVVRTIMTRDRIVEQLRHVWNARGAADLAELEAVLAGASPSMKVIDQVIRTLDR